jgi:hypothetical protein
MNTKTSDQKLEVPEYVRLIRFAVLVLVMLGLAGIGLASADEPRGAGARTDNEKVKQVQGTPQRPRVATQKLMRYPWERLPGKKKALAAKEVAKPASGVSKEELPYFYW